MGKTRPATLAQLSVATDIARLKLARLVDDLALAGLVRLHRARGNRRQPAFETTCQEVVVLYDITDRSECEAVRRHMDAVTAGLAPAARKSRKAGVSHPKGTVYHESRGTFLLRADQHAELRRRPMRWTSSSTKSLPTVPCRARPSP